MRLKFCVVLLTLTALAWAVENTQDGGVRYAAKKMQKPEHVAEPALGTAGAGVETAVVRSVGPDDVDARRIRRGAGV